MKAVLRIGCFTVATLFMVVPNAYADEVTYDLNEGGGSGEISGVGVNQPNGSILLNEKFSAEIGTYQFTGSVSPDRPGLIGVSSGFRAVVSRFVEGFSPEQVAGPIDDFGPEPDDGNTGVGGPFEEPTTQWTTIEIDTLAVGAFNTLAEINGLSSTNSVGFLQFDWAVTGTSGISIESGSLGDVRVNEAASTAVLRVGSEDTTLPDVFLHSPAIGSGGSVNDAKAANLQADSFLLPYDFTQLAPGEIPLFQVDFQLAVSTRLDITNVDDLGNFEALFDANFSNTATLTNVTVLDSNEVPIQGASVIDTVTGQSIVASSVPEPSTAVVLVLAGCVGFTRRRRFAA